MSRIQNEAELAQMLARGGARVLSELAPRDDAVGEMARQQQPTGARLFPLPVPPPTAKVDRYRSHTERLFAETLLAVGLANGMLKQYWYEPCKGLYLAPHTSYTPDFLVQYQDPARPLEFIEVKGGFIRPKDFQKTKQAAALYPCWRFLVAQYKEQRWMFKEVPAW